LKRKLDLKLLEVRLSLEQGANFSYESEEEGRIRFININGYLGLIFDEPDFEDYLVFTTIGEHKYLLSRYKENGYRDIQGFRNWDVPKEIETLVVKEILGNKNLLMDAALRERFGHLEKRFGQKYIERIISSQR